MSSAFIATVETDAKAVEQDIIADAKAAVSDMENIIVTDVDPALLSAWQIIQRNGGSLLLTAAGNVLPSLVAGQWSTAVTNLIADAKAAGATTVTAEEQLAGSTALQIVQAAQAVDSSATLATTPASTTTASAT